MFKKITLILNCVFISLVLNAQVNKNIKKVLFLGNSYTSINYLPLIISSLASSAGDSLIFEMNAPGGFRLYDHFNDFNSKFKIAKGDWDYVVLQEQSQLPSFPIADVAKDVLPFAAGLNQLIKDANACTITQFYMTWGRKNGDSSNCVTWPPVCTYRGMDSLLQLRYKMMANYNKAELSPVGAVWNYLRSNFPSIELYQSDESHPSLAGSYAAACCFYSSIFRADPTLIKSDYGLNALEAVVIRNAVKTVFYNQMNNWNIGINTPNAEFETLYTDSTLYLGRRIRFTAIQDSADAYIWDMGNGLKRYSRVVEVFYDFPGQYADFTVTLIVYGCPNDTFSKVIRAFKNYYYGMYDLSKETKNIKLIPNPASQQINLVSETYNFNRNKIIVRDILGRQVMEENICTSTPEINLMLNLNAGTYFIEVWDTDRAMVYQGKFIVVYW